MNTKDKLEQLDDGTIRRLDYSVNEVYHELLAAGLHDETAGMKPLVLAVYKEYAYRRIRGAYDEPRVPELSEINRAIYILSLTSLHTGVEVAVYDNGRTRRPIKVTDGDRVTWMDREEFINWMRD